MNEHELLLERINLLEYHQKLLIKLLKNPELKFYQLMVEKGITKQEKETFFYLCDKLSMKLEEQKAEGYVYYQPLFDELSAFLPAKLSMKEVINTCLAQNLYKSLFQELGKYL